MRFTLHSLLAVLVLSIAAFGQSINLDTQVKGSRLPMWGVDSGAANAYAITTIAPLGPSLRTGSSFAFIATHANTSASTLVVDGGSAIAIKKNVSTALASGDIPLNGVVLVTYDGTNFQLINNVFSGSISCSQMPALTGDVTSSAGSCATTLASVVTAGSCGDSTHSCGLTYDAKGRITGATNNSISGGGGGGSGSFFGLWNFTAPPSASWSWDNQGSSTIDSSFGYEYLTSAAAAGTQLRVRYRTAPATPYIVDTAILQEMQGALAGSGNGLGSICIGFRQSSTGKLLAIELMNAGTWNTVVTRWTTTTSGNVDQKNFSSSSIENNFRNPSFIRMRDDGTSLYFDLSVDGNHWVNFYSESRTAQFAGGPDQIMYGALQFSSGGAVNIALVNWNVH